MNQTRATSNIHWQLFIFALLMVHDSMVVGDGHLITLKMQSLIKTLTILLQCCSYDYTPHTHMGWINICIYIYKRPSKLYICDSNDTHWVWCGLYMMNSYIFHKTKLSSKTSDWRATPHLYTSEKYGIVMTSHVR